ncbi:MAG: carboxypeptidase-like regulatory domain-containing protein [Chitinophagaceae bacterium]
MQIFTPFKHVARLLTLSFLLTPAISFAQDVAFNNRQSPLNKQEETSTYKTLGSLLSEIEKKHTVSFICRSELLEIKINADKLNFKGKTFVEKLKEAIKPFGLTVRQVTKQQYVIVKTDEPVTSISNRSEVSDATLVSNNSGRFSENELKVSEQAIQISGTVTVAATRLPLQGVTVAVKGTTIATVTDDNGSYQINIPNEQSTLVFSYVGYLTAERVVNNQQRIDVVLE